MLRAGGGVGRRLGRRGDGGLGRGREGLLLLLLLLLKGLR